MSPGSSPRPPTRWRSVTIPDTRNARLTCLPGTIDAEYRPPALGWYKSTAVTRTGVTVFSSFGWRWQPARIRSEKTAILLFIDHLLEHAQSQPAHSRTRARPADTRCWTARD